MPGIGSEEMPPKIPVRWESGTDIKTLYANHVLITHTGNEFYMVFGEAIPPHSMEGAPEYVRIEPVVRVAVSPGSMLQISEAIRSNVGKFLEKLEEAEAKMAEAEEE
jgi:hypothetical protein